MSEVPQVEGEKKKKILLVDDEVRVTRMLKRSLENTGQFEVRTENNSTNIKEVAGDFKPDLILIDVSMPDKNGIEVVREIRKDGELRHTCIVFITGLMGEQKTGHPTKEIEGCLCLPKTLEEDDLIYYIDKQISQSTRGINRSS